ncbi:MAG: AAA family ATPase [Pyrinomonadaceae bacterium]|nr:AAA family ATPase [Pyrinomonadaceae bacterium]MDQ3134473.1 AAA family ATPase [Acidobacteriota bacterium]
MSHSPRIVITGFMGAGKTTVACALAAHLDCQMLDLDDFITARTGRTPQEIIDEEGEPRFREIETAALRQALEQTPARAIALGGGAWAIADNRALVAQHNCVSVWLDAPFNLCWRRIVNANDAARPLARDRGSAQLRYDERRQFYQLAAARVEIKATSGVADVVAEIVELVKR